MPGIKPKTIEEYIENAPAEAMEKSELLNMAKTQ